MSTRTRLTVSLVLIGMVVASVIAEHLQARQDRAAWLRSPQAQFARIRADKMVASEMMPEGGSA